MRKWDCILDDFTTEELRHLRDNLSLSIVWNAWEMEEEDSQDATIVEIEVLYDGILNFQEDDFPDAEFGLRVLKGRLEGYPAPVFRIRLSKAVRKKDVYRAIYGTCYALSSPRLDEPCYAEEHNGYTRVSSIRKYGEHHDYYNEKGVYCGWRWADPAGIQDGIRIPSTNFMK